MDFKIVVSCRKCYCSFELRPEFFNARKSMECPNCGNKFPDKTFSELKSGILSLGRVPERIDCSWESVEENEAFKIRVKEYSLCNELLGKNNN